MVFWCNKEEKNATLSAIVIAYTISYHIIYYTNQEAAFSVAFHYKVQDYLNPLDWKKQFNILDNPVIHFFFQSKIRGSIPLKYLKSGGDFLSLA